jgi:hypothetical protein
MIPGATFRGADATGTLQEPESRARCHERSPEDAAPRLPRLVVVSYLTHAPFTPRGLRTRALLTELRREWTVELVAGPSGSAAAESYRVRRSMARRVLSLLHSSTMLDRVEPWSWRRFRHWNPVADAALLIGYPFSPLTYAARILSSERIPYVVDVGDPWVLTASKPLLRGLGAVRARAAETRLWSGASGAIVTTAGQANALRATFPTLPVLARANGLDMAARSEQCAGRQRTPGESASVLTIAHFGQLSHVRVSIAPFLDMLANSRRWERIELHQFGSDWSGDLAGQSAAQVFFHEPRPWSEIINIAARYDLALVIGNRDPTQLPSKAVSYLQLPIPRLAVVRDHASDSLADYVADKPGWLTLEVGASDIAARIHDHVSRPWTWAELRPPETESWDRVADTVVGFLGAVLAPRLHVGLAATSGPSDVHPSTVA